MSDRHPRAARRRRPEPPPAPASAEPSAGEPSVIRATLYRDGREVSSPATLAETYRQLREHPDGMAWIGLQRPT